MTNDSCRDPGTYPVNISLSSCFGSQFVCGDGSCLHINKRCDQRRDCLDNSDERNCKILVMDADSYIADHIPPSLNPGEKLGVTMEVDIFRMKMAETFHSSSIQFQMTLRWRDARLNFNHLNREAEKNILKRDEKMSIWTPVIIFHNTKDKSLSLTDVRTTLLVHRSGTYSISPMSSPWKSRFYLGSENSLEHSRDYSADFQCEFVSLINYPFDTQECYMIFSLPVTMENSIQLDLSKVTYHGPRMLSQYAISRYHIISMSNTTEKIPENTTRSSQIIRFVLKRRSRYQLVTIYLPTFCLLVIMHTTHYYTSEHFEAQVMVGLTGMLVMTTLLLSVSNHLPPTNYVKLIDVWMLYGLICPFFDIIIHTMAAHYCNKANKIRVRACH